ncbi:MAG TPA: methyltransferase domain-containing protein [Sporichthyaceae bacterium]|nr:methyltransferase domain-containing protein [Sporichthyaceae bacterium]
MTAPGEWRASTPEGAALIADTGLDLAMLLDARPTHPGLVVAIILDEQCPGDRQTLAAAVARSPAHRIVIVDDGTGGAAWVPDFPSTGVEFIRHQRPIGHARCLAAVAATAPGADVVVLDGDMVVGPGWLAELGRVARGLPNLAAVSAQVLARSELLACPQLTDTEIARAFARAPRASVSEAAVLGRGCVLLTAAGIQAARADVGATALSAEDVRIAGSRRGLRSVRSPRVLTITERSERGDLRARQSDESPDAAVAVLADLQSRAAIPPRRLYAVDGEARRPDADSLPASLSHVQESFVVELHDAGFDLWRALWYNRDDLLAYRGQDRRHALATVMVNLGVDLVQVDNTSLAAPSVLGVAGGVGVRRVVTGSMLNDAPHPVSQAEAMVLPAATSDELILRAGIDPSSVWAIDQPPPVDFLRPVRQHRARSFGPLRVIALADGDPRVAEVIRTLAEHTGPSVEFHLIAQTEVDGGTAVIAHRLREPGAMRQLLTEIDPDLGLVVDPEGATHAPQAAMFWGLQLPVVAVGSGATAARIASLGGGISARDPQPIATRLQAIAANPDLMRRLRAEVSRHPVLPMAVAAERHRSCYDGVIHRKGSPPRVGYLMKGHRDRHGSCEHIRVLGRVAYTDPAGVTIRQVFMPEILHFDALRELDVLLVQERLIGPDAEPLLAAVRKSRVRLVIDLDDDLFDPDALEKSKLGEQEFARLGRELTSRLRAADTVLVSTDVLAERVAALCRHQPVVLPNRLNPRLWTSEVPTHTPPRRKGVRVLYMGTTTHLEDLLLVRPALDEVAARIGTEVTLEVIGVAESFEDDEWISRLHVPRYLSNYPEFVVWLRGHRGRWDAAIAPLLDSRFNAGKSDLKLLEYALLGLPTVASDAGPYRGAEHLARLTANEPSAWADALSEVLGDLSAARKRAEAARAHVLSERMITAQHAREWLTVMVGAPQPQQHPLGGGTEPEGATMAEQLTPAEGNDAVHYADGAEDAVLATLSAAADRSAGSDELAQRMHVSWEMNYHFSPQRLGLITPLRVAASTRVADLGCGSGVMCRALGESGASVVGIEGVRSRAAAARVRCADLPNVEIVDGRAETTIEGYSDLDVVLICGLLEYAAKDDEAGPARLLKAATNALAPNGVVAIAIENQLGLGYLVGRHEDHHDTPWVGMADYPLHRRGPRTWSTRKLTAMLGDEGLTTLRWFVPYPDYKLPRVVLDADIFTRPDAADLVDKLVRDPFDGAFRGNEALVSGRRLQRRLIEEGLGLSTAPCFFVVCGRSPEAVAAHTRDDLGWMINNGRLANFRRTRALTRDLRLHTLGGGRSTTVGWLTQHLDADSTLLPGQPMDTLLLDALHEGDEAELHRLLALWHSAAGRGTTSTPDDFEPHPFLTQPGVAMWPPDRLDSHPGNWILTPNGSPTQVDDEWRAATGVDGELAALRALFLFAREVVTGRSAHPYGANADVRQVMVRLCEPLGLAEVAQRRWTELMHAEAALQHIVIDHPTADLSAELDAQGDLVTGPRLWDVPGGLQGSVTRFEELSAANDVLRSQITFERRLARRAARELAKTEAALRSSRANADKLRHQAKQTKAKLARLEASRALRIGRLLASPAREVRALRRRGRRLLNRVRRDE